MSTPPPDAIPCPDLGKGWLIQTVPRKTGKNIDRYWYSPCGRRFRSRPEVDRFLAKEKSRDSKSRIFKHSLGKRIYKSFRSESGAEREFGGEIVSYDTKRKLYTVVYEDGDDEEMSDGEIDRLLSMKKSQKRSSEKSAKSPASSNKKRKKLTEPDLSNPYKKMYMSKKSTPDGNKTKSGAVSVSDTLSNTRATAGSDEKSKTKKRDRKSSALLPPINNIPAKEMRAAILENSLPAALLALPSISSQTEPPSNKISIMEAAQQRLDEANRWVASASMSVESARKHLDSVTRARNAALTAKMEATEFLRIVTAMQLQKTLNGTSADMESSQRQISVKESLAGETKDDNEPSDKRDNLLKKSSDVDDDTAETVEKSHGKVCHGFTICLDKDDSNGVAAEEHPKTTEQNSSKKTNSLPLKKRQSNIEVNGRPEGHPESLVNNTLNSDEMEDNKQKNNNSDDAIIHLKTIPAPSKQNRRFNDLTPEAKEILRKIVLSSLSKNGKIDAAAMKRATDIGIPEQAVISAVKVAWDKLRNTVADAAKNMGASVLHGIELRGLGLAEFDGVYERCLEESPYSKVDPDHPPSFQKKLTYNDQTAVFRLYHTDVPGHWEISFVDKDGKEEKKYSGAIARPKKASGGDTAKSFEREWVSVAGKVCSVTITPLYCERV